MRQVRRLTESDLNRIVKKAVNEVVHPGWADEWKNPTDEIVEDLKRKGYEVNVQKDGTLYVKYAINGNLSHSQAMEFYNLTGKIIDSGWTLKGMQPTNGGVWFIFRRNKFADRDIYYRN